MNGMNIEELQWHWDGFGKTNPLWAILTNHEKRWELAEFFQTGVDHIAVTMERVHRLQPDLRQHRCLDFGCGVGRLTQAMATHFDWTHGVDIAPSMIAQARTYNQYPDTCFYHVNTAPHLGMFQSGKFDFVHTVIVLQHIRPDYSRIYISEMLRLLAAGGVLLFQIPGEYTSLLDRYRLPERAFQARLRLAAPPTTLTAGEQVVLPVQVTNASPETWQVMPHGVTYHMGIGNQWYTPAGEVAVLNDGRAYLEAPLPPGETAVLPLAITAPATPGRYLLRVDIVQEAVAWGIYHQSPVLELEVVSTPAAATPVVSSAAPVPDVPAVPAPAVDARPPTEYVDGKQLQMEMHGIPQDEVIALLEQQGGIVLEVERDDSVGLEWSSYTYYVTRH